MGKPGRPTKLTPGVLAALQRLYVERGTLAALRTAAAAEGINLSLGTLCRWRQQHAAPPPLELPTAQTPPPAVHVPAWLSARIGLGGAP